jgi:hypothetical protein
VLVQRVVAPGGAVSWTVVDEHFEPVEPIERYLAHLQPNLCVSSSRRSGPSKPNCGRRTTGYERRSRESSGRSGQEPLGDRQPVGYMSTTKKSFSYNAILSRDIDKGRT